MSTDAMQVKDASARYLAKAAVQEVLPGYKRTEVGVIPEDWDHVCIGDVASVKGGKRLPSGYSLVDTPTPHPYVRVTDMYHGGVALSEIKYVPENAFPAIQRYRIYSEDIFISVAGTLGIVGVVPPELSGANLTENADRIIDLRCERDYLKYWLMSQPIQQTIEAIRTVGAQPKLALGRIAKFDIAVPQDRVEQRAIAEALSDVDGLLGALAALIAKKRAIKQATMQQLLTGKTRLPGFSGAWETKRLWEIAEMGSGGTPLSTIAAYYDGNISWVSISDMTKGDKVLHETERNLTAIGYANCAAKMFPSGTVLYAMYASLGECCIAGIPVCTSQAILGIQVHQELDNGFLYYYLTALKPKVKALGQQGTQANLNKGMVKDFYFSLPLLDEQTAIATVLADMDAEIAALERRRDKTRAIKQGMMQQLLTGRVRLVKPEAPSEQSEAGSKTTKAHSWAFNEAVVIAVLAKQFGSDLFPLGRMRYTKLSYLLHRHAEKQADGYLKKAAGPYNPKTKYGGPEKIAIQNGYVRDHRSGQFRGFVGADNITQAEGYFEKWYGREVGQWMEQFRLKKNDELEVLATVDMAAEELRAGQRPVDMDGVKDVIRSHPEWQAKLDRPVFSDTNIVRAIRECGVLFGDSTDEPNR